MRSLPFAKLHAAGNHFIVVDGRNLALPWNALAQAMARTHDGVGADGLLVLGKTNQGSLALRIFNADGGEAELSGNGLLLAAKYASDRGWPEASGGSIRFETGGGPRTVRAERSDGRLLRAEVSLGMARGFVERRLETPLGAVDTACFSLGNPHCVIVTDEPVETAALDVLGPAIEHHAAFPDRVNLAVVNVVGPDRLKVRLHERGLGETRSSGTGSTAAAFAAMHQDLIQSAVTVECLGGSVLVRRDEGGELHYRNTPVEVFRGEWSLPGAEATAGGATPEAPDAAVTAG